MPISASVTTAYNNSEKYECGTKSGDLSLNDCVTRTNGERYCICVGEKCNADDIEAFVLAALLRSGAEFSASAAASFIALCAAVVIARNINGRHATNDWRT